MTDWSSDFVPKDGQELFPRTLGETLAKMVRKRWPQNTPKRVAAAWDLDPTTAKNLTKGHASERTITKALKAEGWPLLMAIGEAMTGESYDTFLRGVIDEQVRAAARSKDRRDHIRRLEARAAELVDVPDRQVA